MHAIFPLDLASRASNLSERIHIVEALHAQGVSVSPHAAPSAFDVWHMHKLADQLAGQFFREALRRETSEKNTKEYLLDILTAYKLFELNVHEIADHARDLYTEVHRTWLPTYQQTLQTFDSARNPGTAANWRQPDIYYGKFARACEPFLLQLGQELRAACNQANASLGREVFTEQVIADIQDHFLHRFELPLAWALEVEANVYCTRTGLDKARATADDYITYLETTFLDQEAYHRFYLRFPTLGRWLALVTRFLIENGRTLIARLRDDLADIADAFFGQEIGQIRSVKLGKSDYHVGGQSVAFVEVVLADAQPGTFVYKPRCLRSEVAMQGMLERLAGDGVLVFATYPMLAKEGYGYAACLPQGRNHVETAEEAGQIYAELGGYLGLFHVLGGSDIHFENVLVAAGHAFICDGETVLGVLPFGQERPVDTVRDSVYRTGLLEWPHTPAADAVAEMRVSGYAGGEAFQAPISLPRISQQRCSFDISVKHETGIQVDPAATNRIFLAGQLVQPEAFQDQIMDGFQRVHDWFQQNASIAIPCLSALFEDASVRFVSWSTQVYTQLLLSAQHPKCLMEPLEVDLVINSLREHPRKWDQHGLMAACELASLWQLDIPMFTVQAHSQTLVHDRQMALPMTLEVSPLAYATERIARLSPENRMRQMQYIAASLSANEVHSPAFVSAAVDYARQIGWQICALLRAPSERAPWRSYKVTAQGIEEIDIHTDLYNGTAGIALFLAYLDALAPQPEFRYAAERALSYTITACDRQVIGAFQGVGGLIYLLTHLYALWHKPHLLDLAIELSRDLASRIEQDREFDVLSGAAGVIPVMLGLAEVSSGAGLDCAQRCAHHLLQHAEKRAETLSWPLQHPEEAKANLTGFAHGTSGIGWALISVGCATHQPDYISAGKQAFAYEKLHFDEQEQDWYDLRTRGVAALHSGLHFANAWCNGAAGIGLSRIASWAMLGKNDDDLLQEAYIALAATLRNFHRLGTDTPCHGKAGNAEFFLRFAQLKGEPAFQMEANVQAQAQWRNFEKANNWIFGGVSQHVFPGFMIGLAGLGMHFLRLAYPERVPSPLLLDAPIISRPVQPLIERVNLQNHTRRNVAYVH